MKKPDVAPKHPPGLYVLCATEAGERFGFYLLATLFVLWLQEKLGYKQDEAFSINGWYRFFVYLAPFGGGWLADWRLGYRRAVMVGAPLLAVGYALLGTASKGSPLLLGALALLVCGNGLFKPNISTLVGGLYPQGDPRRDDAFSMFYFGINTGAFASPLVGEAMRSTLGWTAAFLCAAIALGLSQVLFLLLRHHLDVADQRSSVSAVLGVPLGPEYEDQADPPEVERDRVVALLVLCAVMLFFWLAFLQNENALVLWARDNTDRVIWLPDFRAWSWFRWEIPPGVFNSVNPAFILMLTPVTTWFFGRFLRSRGLEPSTPTKIVVGMVLTAAAYVIMAVAGLSGGDHGRVSLLWLVASYLVITIAELLLSPMGLSMVTKLSPRRLAGMLMGTWFFSTAVGGLGAGKLGAWFWSSLPHSQFFGLFVAMALLATVLMITQYRRIAAAIPR